MDIIPSTRESELFWDIEKYCLTYQKYGTTYELYDQQQILYPSKEYVLCVNCCTEARNKPSRRAVYLSFTLVPLATVTPLTPLVSLWLCESSSSEVREHVHML